MIDQGSYEVVRTDAGWRWRLIDAEVCLAMAPEPVYSARAARSAIDRVRDAAVQVAQADRYVSDADAVDRGAPAVSVHGDEATEVYEWALLSDGDVLAVPRFTYTERAMALDAARRFVALAGGALPVYLTGAVESVDQEAFEVGGSAVRGALGALLRRGRRHRQFLEDIDTRIVVSGIRGKSSTVRRLDDVFNRRGYDVLTKITGNEPHLIRNGDVIPIDRTGPYTTLYENVRVLREFGPQLSEFTPEDVAIFENQGITEYTTRLINRRFVKPHVVVLANVRQDHQDTLGKSLRDIARAFARTIPPGTTVVNGEQNPLLAKYMREEIEQQGGEVTQVSIPEDQEGRIGAETVYATNDVLRLLEMDPIPEEQLTAYLDAIQPRWVRVPGGRVFNGAEINDIESTEAIREALADDNYVLPFVYLRSDRRSRTASFANYLNTLADRDLIRQARAGGAFTDVFADHVEVPVTTHDRDEDAGRVLDEMLAEEYPVLLMGNTVDEFMRDMDEEITERATRGAVEEAD